jgi:hypothetical protein
MSNLVAIFFTFIGVTLVSLSSLGLVAIARLKGIVSNALAFAVIAYATIVLLAQILSELHFVNRLGFLIGHIMIVLIVLAWGIKTGRLQLVPSLSTFSGRVMRLKQWAYADPALTLLGICVLTSMLLGAYLILIVPPNIWDSLFVNLSKVALWLDNQTLRHFQTDILKKTVFPINAEIGLLWSIALWGNDRLGGFIQWFATILLMVGIYGIARQLRYSSLAGLFAALIWSTFTIVVLQSTSTKNDTLVAFFLVAAFYFLLAGLRDTKHNYNLNFVLFGMSFGLAIGTKPLVAMIVPGLGVMAGLLILYKPSQFLPKFIYAGLWFVIGFTLLGSYNYILNWFDYHSITGPPSISQEHLVENLSLASFKTNLGQISYHFFDPGGLPTPFVDFIQWWRPPVGQKIFSLLAPDALETGFYFEDTRQIVPREDGAWFGPLGFLLFWPTIFFYLFITPFTHKTLASFFREDIWKWSIALISFSFVLVFALLFRWNPWIGRMFIIPVALGAPLMAGFYVWSEKYKVLQWGVVIIAIVVLGWSSTHNFHKPVLGTKTIWELDYYDLRTIQEPEMAAIYRYVDANVPKDAKLGLAGEWPANRWDYLFIGPNLEREYSYLGRIPERITQGIFEDHNVEYIILASKTPETIDSETPLWPIGWGWGLKWFLVKRSEAESFALQPCQPTVKPEAFGAGYLAYRKIKQTLEKETQSFRVLTTDFRMPCYEKDERFVFDTPKKVENLETFTHLVIPLSWSDADYKRLGGLPLRIIQNFLLQEGIVEEEFDVDGYVVYRILLNRDTLKQ